MEYVLRGFSRSRSWPSCWGTCCVWQRLISVATFSVRPLSEPSAVWTCRRLLLHSPVGGHRGCFQSWPLGRNHAVWRTAEPPSLGERPGRGTSGSPGGAGVELADDSATVIGHPPSLHSDSRSTPALMRVLAKGAFQISHRRHCTGPTLHSCPSFSSSRLQTSPLCCLRLRGRRRASARVTFVTVIEDPVLPCDVRVLTLSRSCTFLTPCVPRHPFAPGRSSHAGEKKEGWERPVCSILPQSCLVGPQPNRPARVAPATPWQGDNFRRCDPVPGGPHHLHTALSRDLCGSG